ncbi:PREDICTED: transcription factor DIVARICATA-like isoform X1 [Tarenaya hassleriana]|uniref:transcription factor DIVARICATA-like isoform X1 n=1 Tax=Tarenaya hassleriana TaxID=28532 RepID=UPI00053C6C26|nr:PREDICTED: transcription factor DIVARICATA-like isoform X1 [Tarenaya hassleriana]
MDANYWTRTEDKMFEEALVTFSELMPDRWQRISEILRRSQSEVYDHYYALVHDVSEIDSGRVNVPAYADHSPASCDSPATVAATRTTPKSLRVKRDGTEKKKKGTPWTENEHRYVFISSENSQVVSYRFRNMFQKQTVLVCWFRLFLIGLGKYGRGDWRSISRNVVVSRTPTQVASHAQKYFLRQAQIDKERKRASIHDLTTVDNDDILQWNTLQPQPQPQSQPPLQQPQPQPQVLQPLPLLSMNQQFMLVQGHAQLPPRDYQSLGQFPGDLDFRL